ncbi:MAG: TlyA family RNA methyltransferase [bacterium]
MCSDVSRLRLDLLLVERGLLPSCEIARSEIMAGNVLVDEIKVQKAGHQVRRNADIRLLSKPRRYVSRGGYKLEKALDYFSIDVTGLTVLDAGASTGGFTDCLLQRGAARVYAVDVGYGQLAWSLRNDSRVIVKERTNIRYLAPEDLGERVDMVTADLAFLSLTKVVGTLAALGRPGAKYIFLVKPQFEVKAADIGKHGVVHSFQAHAGAIEGVVSAAVDAGLAATGLTFSPIKGPEGNIEYLLYLTGTAAGKLSQAEINHVVKEAEQALA